MNLEKMSVAELRSIQARLPHAIKAKEREALAEVKAKMSAMAEKQGLTLAEIIGNGGSKRRAAIAAKYRSPDGQTWSGRGRRPLWLKGKDPEQFRVA